MIYNPWAYRAPSENTATQNTENVVVSEITALSSISESQFHTMDSQSEQVSSVADYPATQDLLAAIPPGGVPQETLSITTVQSLPVLSEQSTPTEPEKDIWDVLTLCARTPSNRGDQILGFSENSDFLPPSYGRILLLSGPL